MRKVASGYNIVPISFTNFSWIYYGRYMCRGVENLPIVIAGLPLPPSTRLNLVRTSTTVRAGELVMLANVSGKAGLLRQTNMVINSSSYSYQEGCISAIIDGTNDLWLSSGLEDYFLGACKSLCSVHLTYISFI